MNKVEITFEIRRMVKQLGDFYPARKMLAEDIKINVGQYTQIIKASALKTIKEETYIELKRIYEEFTTRPADLQEKLDERIMQKKLEKKERVKQVRTGLKVVEEHNDNGGKFKKLEVGKTYKFTELTQTENDIKKSYKAIILAEYKRHYLALIDGHKGSILKNDLYRQGLVIEKC